MRFWKKIDESHNLLHIRNDDLCIYAREYHPGQGYNAGETNQLILNFKKFGTAKGKPEWAYRNRDVKRFALEASQKFTATSSASVTAVPGSKSKSEAEYSNRFEDMLDELKVLRPNIQIEWPIEIQQTVEPSHASGSRVPIVLKQNYKWNGFKGNPPEILVVFDDIITTGSHFRAFSDFLRDNGFTGKIVGIFWARSVYPDPADDFEPVEE